ncbi:MAG: cation diffusion facilitator family transporter [bacterium]|nr:cation diffusion facilitator family transporter [bacterium]
MFQLISRIFISENQNYSSPKVKQEYAKLCGLIEIGINIGLFLIKYTIGTISGLVSIQADGLNNLSDVVVAIISLLGFLIAGIGAGDNHPFGHGRFEWIMGIFSSTIVIYLGCSLIKESIQAIKNPLPMKFDGLMCAMLVLSIGAKFYMYLYNKKIGTKIDSISLNATAADSLGDMISTTVILLSVLVQKFSGIQIDGWAGLLVAAVIIVSGIKSMAKGIERILGESMDEDTIKKIESLLGEYPMIDGVSNLFVHDYGMGHMAVSMHIEGDSEKKKEQLTMIAEELSFRLYQIFGCEATIQVDILNMDATTTCKMEGIVNDTLEKIQVTAYPKEIRVLPMDTHTIVNLTIACDHMEQKREEAIKKELEHVFHKISPDYQVKICFVLEIINKTLRGNKNPVL